MSWRGMESSLRSKLLCKRYLDCRALFPGAALSKSRIIFPAPQSYARCKLAWPPERSDIQLANESIVFACADDALSRLAPEEATSTDSVLAESQRKLFETMLQKACPRPLIVSRLKSKNDTSGYGSCLCGDASLLAAFSAQVSHHYY